MLNVQNLHASYGRLRALSGVTFSVAAGEIVTILGRNGSGRSTTCKAIIGMVPPTTGQVELRNRNLAGLPPHQIARAGIGYVPEERRIFGQLTVEENLQLGMQPLRSGSSVAEWRMDDLYAKFPRLHERRHVKAGFLSGGEQQVLTIFRTLLGNPLAILIDEPTEGLAPMIVDVVSDLVVEMKQRGLGIVLMEQKLAMALRLADRVLVMGRGQIVFSGSPAAFEASSELRKQWLEVA